jgi:hypothetical protein
MGDHGLEPDHAAAEDHGRSGDQAEHTVREDQPAVARKGDSGPRRSTLNAERRRLAGRRGQQIHHTRVGRARVELYDDGHWVAFGHVASPGELTKREGGLRPSTCRR